MNLNPNLTPHTKFNSKWLIDLDAKAKAIGLLKENLKNLYKLGSANIDKKHMEWKKKT